MGYEMCIINHEYGTYFHGQDNYFTGASFESLTIERLGGRAKIIENEVFLLSKNRFHDMYQYKRIFMHGPIGALEKCMHSRLRNKSLFSKSI